MPYLSSPIEEIKAEYTVVVIGSGYGGGIAASRLARAGQRVCVLERGKEFQPGEYPNTDLEFFSETQVHLPGSQPIGSQLGLYDFKLNPDLNSLVGCGLGGTSLINANVALRPEPRVFDDPCWPKAFRDDLTTRLEEGYRRAEEMLKPAKYPDKAPRLPKMAAQMKSAAAFGEDKFKRLDINVTFEDFPNGLNHVGVPQQACKFCGDCMSGCNYRAKNTTLMNYLPDAKSHGAEIYTCVSVRYLERKDNRWVVHYQIMGEGREMFESPTAFVSAEIVILAAGVFGSTEILLRSKANGLPLSDQLGKHFSGNGDTLGFAYNSDDEINMVGFGNRPPGSIDAVGPTITSVIDLREQPKLEDGLIIEEGGVMGAWGTFLPLVLAASARLAGKDTDSGLIDAIAEETRELDSLVRGPYHGAIKNTQVYLVMSYDDAGGTLYLDKETDDIRLMWPGAGEENYINRVYDKLAQATKPLGGTFVENPLWSKLTTHNLVSAHPLGGCAMGEDAGSGVVNHKGQVFSGTQGTATYDGLYVNDGAIIPRSLGCNPHITISAIAERNCALLIQERGWQIDYSFTPPAPTPASVTRPGIKLTEAMEGFFSVKVKEDYQEAFQRGEDEGSTFRFVLTVEMNDIEAIIRTPDFRSELNGTVTAPALSAESMTAIDGGFYLFVHDPNFPEMRLMVYQMKLISEEGKTYYFNGRKYLHDNAGFDMLSDATTLYITVYEGENDQGQVVGKGILRIPAKDVPAQLRTFQVTNAANLGERLATLGKFGRYMFGELFDIYGGVFARPTLFNPDAPPRQKRPLRVGLPEVHYFKTDDGLGLRLIRYRGGKKGPVILAHGLGVSSLIFSTDLIETNLLEYLYVHGYDVWLLDYRSSIEMPYAATQYTADDVAAHDWPAAVKTVMDLTRAASVQTVAHCYGAITFNMAMLAGLKGVRSAVCSQVGSHLSVNTGSKFKAVLHLDELLKALDVKSLSTYVDSHENWANQLFDKALDLILVADTEKCNNPVCHRISFLYAPLYEHTQLNAVTHDNLHEMFGSASISNFEHIAIMTRAGYIVNARGENVYLPHAERMAIPIAFIHGEDNQTWLPDSTRHTYEFLCAKNGKQLYSRYLIPHHGHIDCIFGKDASRDVYPLILKHLEATQV